MPDVGMCGLTDETTIDDVGSARNASDILLVRPFCKEDAPTLLELMRELAVFEGYIDRFVITEADLIEHGFGEAPRFGAFVAVQGETGALVGTAVHYVVPWTYDLKPTLVLKELFVAKAARGLGAGRLLMEAIAGEAERVGAPRVVWNVLNGNNQAVCFYTSVGGKADTKWQPWILDTTAIRALAASRSRR